MGRTKGSKNGVFGNGIEKDKFEYLCKLMCTQEEICGFFGCHTDTLDRFIKQNYGEEYTFNRIYPILSANGKISLRRNQFELSKTNASMAIFLGKQYLDQREYTDATIHERISVVNDVPETDDTDESDNI